MKQVSELTQNITLKPNQLESESDSQQDLSRSTAIVVNELMARLRAIFPAWGNAYKTQRERDEHKRQWLLALIEHRINSIEQIQNGLIRARSEKTPFAITPGLFCDWCSETHHKDWPATEKLLELVHKLRLYQQDSNYFIHKHGKTIKFRPLVYDVKSRIDWFRFQQMKTSEALSYLDEIYSKLKSTNYVEQNVTDTQQLESRDTIRKRMTQQQVDDEKNRNKTEIEKILKKLK